MEFLKGTNFNFISKYRTGFIFSSVVILIGLVFLSVQRGPNFGIDFRGGVKIQAKFNRQVTETELATKLTELGYEQAKIQIDAGKNEASISMGHRPEFQEQFIDIPVTADPGDATATRLQVSSTAEKVHLLRPGTTVELIDGNTRQRKEIQAREAANEGTTIELTFAEEFGVDLSEKTIVQIQASIGTILTEALLTGGRWVAGNFGGCQRLRSGP